MRATGRDTGGFSICAIIYHGLFQKQVRADLLVIAKLLTDTHYFESININADKINLSTDINELRVTWIK